MKNKEKYFDELMEIIISGCLLAVDKQTNRPKECYNISRCDECLFHKIGCNDESRKEWLEEEYQEPPILDEKEKEYLSAVIRPWRDIVSHIFKCKYGTSEKIVIVTKRSDMDIYFPFFEKGTMYKGMKLNRKYSLEELEI